MSIEKLSSNASLKDVMDELEKIQYTKSFIDSLAEPEIII